MLGVSDFSSSMELIASISIGFVAIEYVKSYTRILCEKIFQYEDFICKAYNECRELLTDKDTLEHIAPIDVDGKNTVNEVEKIKVEHETLHRDITIEEGRQKSAIVDASQSKSLSSLSFYVFLSNTVLLFVGSFETVYSEHVHYMGLIYCSLSALYLILGWIYGEKEISSKKISKVLYFRSLRHSVFSFVVVIIFTLIVHLFLLWKASELLTSLHDFWWIALIIYIFLSYLNFAVFALKIRNQAKGFKNEVNSSKEAMKERCKKLHNEVQDLLALVRIKNKLST